MQHETLSVYLNRDPLNVPNELRLAHNQAHHVPLDCPVIEWLANGVVVKVAEACQSSFYTWLQVHRQDPEEERDPLSSRKLVH